MCVYIYIYCLCVCMYIYIYIYCVRVCVCVYIYCVCVCVYIYKYIYIYIYSDIKQMEPKQLGFLIKAVYDILHTPVDLKLCGLSTSNLYKACGKIANLIHVLTGCQYSLRSYMWRHNEILGIIAEIAKMCCETANKISCIKINIQFVKEGNVLKTPHRNRHKPTLLDGCMDWHAIADRQLDFPTEITSTRQCPDLIIWSVNSKKVIIAELTISFETNIDWVH